MTFKVIAVLAGVFFIVMPSPALAMHISEGILPLPWAVLWFLLSLPFVAAGLRTLNARSKTDPYIKPLVGLVGAAVFVISCMPIPVPTAGTCSHPCGTGMAAILIGPTLSALVASIALVLQALFLAHGGLTTLGANIFSMGVVGSFAGYGVFVLAKRVGFSPIIGAFLAGLISDWATYLSTSLALTGALHGEAGFWHMFVSIILAFVPTQLPLGILEGFLSAGAYKFIFTRRPEFLTVFVKG